MNLPGAGPSQGRLGEPPLRAPVDQSGPCRRVHDRDIIRDREVRDERQFLKNADDSGAAGRGRRAERDLAAVEDDPALVRRDDAGQDLDQRRFSGAVLAEYGMNTPGRDGEVCVLKGAYAAVSLRHALHAEDRRPLLAFRHGLDPRLGGTGAAHARRR